MIIAICYFTAKCLKCYSDASQNCELTHLAHTLNTVGNHRGYQPMHKSSHYAGKCTHYRSHQVVLLSSWYSSLETLRQSWCLMTSISTRMRS